MLFAVYCPHVEWNNEPSRSKSQPIIVMNQKTKIETQNAEL